MHSNIMAQVGFDPDPGTVVDESLIRHSILNTIRANNAAFRGKYGELILVFDSKSGYWRKEIFPFYKARRKKDREESPLDWELIFQTVDKVKGEIIDNFPYRTVEVAGAEADDVIAELSSDVSSPTLILSTDKDLLQLQGRFGNWVEQYDPVRKNFLTHENPVKYLLEKVIKGDRGDGVPNVMMPDDTFIKEVRQKPITAKRLEEFSRDLPRGVGDEEHVRNYKRNDMMIDLKNIPKVIRTSVRETFEGQKPKGKSKLTNYFMKNKLRNLFEAIGDF